MEEAWVIDSDDYLDPVTMSSLFDDEDYLNTLIWNGREEKYRLERFNWPEHVDYMSHINGFQSRYHMTKESFVKLLFILEDDLTVDEHQSRRSTRGNCPITSVVMLATGLRYLGGAKPQEISDIYKISIPSVHRVINMFLDAVEHSDELQIKIPTTDGELRSHANEWNRRSGASGLYYGAVGAIDGWLACTNKPTRRDASNQTDFFSGHYQRYGLNVQAMCDANCRFIFFCIAGPGKTNDFRAFSRCLELREWIDNLPTGFFVIGDNAYGLTNKLLVPFSGAQKALPYNRTYNFYLSQLRIRIEMSFGRLTTKFQIFRKNLNCS